MISIKKYIKAIRDKKLGFQERLFRLFTVMGAFGLAVCAVSGIVTGKSVVNIIVYAAVLVVFVGVSLFCLRFHWVQTGAIIIAALLGCVVMPYNFITKGGVYGGAVVWFMFGFVFTAMVVTGKAKYILLAINYLLALGCYYIAYNYPERITQQPIGMTYLDSLVSLTVVGAVACVLILFQNALFRSENALARNQKKEIEELNKAQNSFFSSMSHEIRTPINTIIGLNEMILREDVSDEVAADARSIQGASKMLLTLINDILDMSKIESGKMDIVPASYNAGDMLSDIVNMIWVRAKEKGLEFHIDVDQSMPVRLYGDEVRIKQILINILNNAVKYTPSGSVTLSIQHKMFGDRIAEISYSVTDTGMGIKKESIPHLFTAFKRVDEQNNRYIEGTGLGLSIVKQLVELMNGTITVNSVYKKGSTFIITIPQGVESEEQIGELDLETRHSINSGGHYKQSFEAPQAKVLIVDDNETNLMVAEKLLRGTKVNVTTVTSGRSCLEKTLNTRYDVIFMDHLMPEMDGIKCLHALRRQLGGLNRDVPVVALTANAGSENQALYKREGFDGYLLKPVSGAQLEAELLRHLPRELVNIENPDASAGIVESPVIKHRKKIPVMISTDSVCDLPEYLVNKYRIAVIPFYVVTDGGEFTDGAEIETDSILSYMYDNKDKHVSSMPPREEDYEEYFAEQLTKAQYIVHLSMAQNTGKAYENALEASKTFDNVYVVDSGNLSGGLGLLVLHAALRASEGLTADAVAEDAERTRDRIKTSFVLDSTEYLARSGRIPQKLSTVCCNLLLHPVMVMKDSTMKLNRIVIGTRDFIRRKYIRSSLKVMGEIDRDTLFIAYSGMTRDELDKIEDQVKNTMRFRRVIFQKASPATSTNCGPGCFGMSFMMEDVMDNINTQ